MTSESRRAVRVVVEGRVQGVGYREFVRRTAVSLGVSGWVRNRSDGGVEAVLAGDGETIDAVIAEMRRGPRFAEVTSLRVEASGEAASAIPPRAVGAQVGDGPIRELQRDLASRPFAVIPIKGD